MPVSELRIAVVGAGGIAQRYHLPSLQRLAQEDGHLHLAALCDIDEERARSVADRFGFARSYADYRRLLDAEAPDAVWVLVPFQAIREVAGYFLAQGVPTLMEKPPGGNAHEVRALLEIATAQHTMHQVGFNRRHAPLLQRMKTLLGEKGVPISALSCQFYRHGRDEAYFAYGTGLHGLDALRYLADSELTSAWIRPAPRGAALVVLEYATGATGVLEMLPQVGIQSERYTAHAGDRTVVVEGVIGWLTLFPGYLQCFEQGQLALAIDNAQDPQPPEIVSGFYGESAHFIAALRGGPAATPDLSIALGSATLAEAVNAAIADGRGDKCVRLD